eukprot:TRINITY_DN5336_c0_g1_i1.p1 TRINITY_DN5336_c0_g1~~TRINITY_DN5336_c0_g1_i1.p1  ORF type:complete len:388 (+),score=70.10 TRINITY_DN5336_c0_g1_i1:412-1575(+)
MGLGRALSTDPVAYKGDPSLLSDQAEVYLEMKDYPRAIASARSAIELVRNWHPDAIKSYTLLIRCYMATDEFDKALETFDRALNLIDFALGPFHPIHATLYSLLGFYYTERAKYDDALVLYKSSLVCCIRAFGQNHAKTAEVYRDLGNLSLKKGTREEAHIQFEKAFLIFEASRGPDSLECALLGYQLASLLLLLGRLREAESFATRTVEYYEKVESADQIYLLSDAGLLLCRVFEAGDDIVKGADAADRLWTSMERLELEEDHPNRQLTLAISFGFAARNLPSEGRSFLTRLTQCATDYMKDEKDELESMRYLQEKCHLYKTVSLFLKTTLRELLQHQVDFYANGWLLDYSFSRTIVQPAELSETLVDWENFLSVVGSEIILDRLK